MQLKQSITIFTDGSCHNQLKTGGWAAIIITDSGKVVLEGSISKTTHQRMELTAVLESLQYLQREGKGREEIIVYSDSQYVVDLVKRKGNLILSNYQTKKSKPIRNSDLVKELIDFMGLPNIRFVKIKSHQRLSGVESILNREVDLLSRKNMRDCTVDA
ncbi:MAG TPA: ribonuclease H [Chryseolinea sp.]|jgi:ribonuclease HI|nr:ribonuclease H [Chryseolinea sp.]